MADLAGQTVGQYRIIEQIGQGGMATVYKAYQPSLDRYVALKVLPPYFAHEPGFAMRFTREAKAIARLNHPNILPIHDFGQEGDLSYIAMKFVEAGTLKDIMDDQPLSLDVTADIIRQVAAALDHAHQRGILHRDVKPSNVLLDEGRWALLTDFGLAKMVEGSVALTGSGIGVGTPAYMAPEQGRGGQVDARADVYSLGVVLYEMQTGRVPFEAETPMAVVIKHITDPLPLPRSVNPELPEAVERVILKALAKNPDDRFAGAGEMADALTSAAAHFPKAADLPAAKPVPSPPPPAPSAPSSAGSAPEPLPLTAAVEVPAPARRRGPWRVVGALAGLTLLALLGVWIVNNLGGEGRGETTPLAVALVTETATQETPVPTRPSPTDTPPPPTRTHTLPPSTPSHTPRPPTPTEPPPSPTPTATASLTLAPTATGTPTSTRTPRPPTNTPVSTPTDTPLPPLPGTETIPLANLAQGIPWLPWDPGAIPATNYYGFNLAKPPFDNPLVRQAFALTVDRQSMADLANALGYVQARPATVLTPADTLGRALYGQVGLSFDPDRARELLAQAGYPGGEGFPQVTLGYNYTERNAAFAQAALAMWRDHLGINVLAEEFGNWDAYIELLNADAPPIFRLGWSADYNDPDNFLASFSGESGAIRGHFVNAEFDTLVEQAATASDPARRQALYIEAERILCEQEAAIIPLFHWLHSEQ